jgi:hypothetical protein
VASKIPITKEKFSSENTTQICPQNATHIDHINSLGASICLNNQEVYPSHMESEGLLPRYKNDLPTCPFSQTDESSPTLIRILYGHFVYLF